MNVELHPGDEAPALESPVAGPGEFTAVFDLAALRGQRVALCFYPYDDVPAAAAQLTALRDAWSRLDGKVLLFGVSRDTVENHRRVIERLGLPFPLVTDEENRLAKAYGIWLGEGGGDVEGGALTERATFLLGADGRIETILRHVPAGEHAARLLDLLSI